MHSALSTETTELKNKKAREGPAKRTQHRAIRNSEHAQKPSAVCERRRPSDPVGFSRLRYHHGAGAHAKDQCHSESGKFRLTGSSPNAAYQLIRRY